MKLYIDFETRSTADLRAVGAHKYAQDPTTGVLCIGWAIDDEPVQVTTPTTECAVDLFNAIRAADQIIAHNAAFERVICQYVMTRRYDWPEIRLEKWRCTMAMAYAMGLPGSLDAASAAVGMQVGKDIQGHRLMLAMCKPRAVHKNEAPGTYWREAPEDFARLYEYCKSDVMVERELEKRLLPLSETEQSLWALDQRINDRGVLIDLDLCKKAQKIVGDAVADLDAEMREVTQGAVGACSNAIQLTAFLRQNGLPVDSVAKDKVDELLTRDNIPAGCYRALELRQQGSLTSVAKFTSFMSSAGDDGRARGLLQYHAASTGRWGGRRVQPQNFKRPEDEDSVPDIIDAIGTGDYRVVEAFYGPVLPAVSDCLRGAIKAAPGHVLCAADLSGIEGRVLAWLAGEQWKLRAYYELDAGRGEDLYKIAYAGAFNMPVSQVSKAQRQVGKPIELALGYEGGPGAFQVMAKSYGVDISESYNELTRRFPQQNEIAVEAWDSRGKKSGIARCAWIAAEIVKLRWRAANPATVAFWAAMKEAAMLAVSRKGAIYTEWIECGPIKFCQSGSFLFMRLPSRRSICLPYPRVEDVKTPWGAMLPALTFMAVDSITNKWVRQTAYGGKLANYATQGTARDVLVAGMIVAENWGYPIVLTVHDEIVAEVPDYRGPLGGLIAFMSAPPAWAAGLPISASGFREERYRK
jgi:DNA polymerase bacteriophage-type